jgi:hypothetical protein
MKNHANVRAVVLRLAAAMAFLLPGSCRSSPGRDGPPLPPPAAIVDVSMKEYSFDHQPIPAGRLVVNLENDGREEHDFVLAALPAGVDVGAKKDSGQLVATVFQTRPRPPGSVRRFAVDLVPGRYAMLCFIQDKDGRTHADKGMVSQFTVVRE